MMLRSCRFACIGVLASLLISLPACNGRDRGRGQETPTSAPRASGNLTFGSVSLNPASEHETYLPFARFVAEQMGDVGIGRGRVVVVDSMSTIVEELRRGTVDVFIDSPFPIAFASSRTDLEVILRRWKRGSVAYRSVLFARADSGIESPPDLVGRMIAFGAPFSTTGFLLPKADLASRGLKLAHFEDAAVAVPRDKVGYVFSEDSENTMFWVLKGKVAAGAVNLDYYEELAGRRIEELRIIHTSDPVPRNLVSVRGDLDPAIVESLRAVLLRLGDSEAGRKILDQFEQTAKFDEIPEGGERALSEIIRKIQYVESDLGQ
jgi:phosphonate transport system substrate-binding protein